MPPSLTVIAGPNGSGKSTLTNFLIRQNIDFGQYINADEIAAQRGLSGEAGTREAQSLADQLRERCLEERKSFSFETVMSHESKPQFIARAREAGFVVTLFFVATADPRLNVARVAARVQLGGHDVPEDRIIARYYRSLALLPLAMVSANRTVVFDNSSPASQSSEYSPLRPVIECQSQDGGLVISPILPVPEWSVDCLIFSHLGYSCDMAKTDGLGVTIAFGSTSRAGDPTEDQTAIFLMKSAIRAAVHGEQFQYKRRG